MKFFLLILVFFSFIFAKELHLPKAHFMASGSVNDIVVQNKKLYAATDASCLDIFSLQNHKKIKTIKLEKIIDFMGDTIDTTIFSVDVIAGKIMMLSQGLEGYNRVYIYEKGKLDLLVADKDHLAISKAKFLDKNTLILALLSDEIISYNITKHKQNYRVDSSSSKFSDFVLNEDKSQVVVADESGDLQLLSTKNGKHLETFSGNNLDDVFGVDYKNGIIATAGKDRRVVIYDIKKGGAYYKTSSFFIYSVGLSPSGKIVAYSSDVNNNITLFDTKTKENIAEYGGNKSPLSKILFLNENEFIVSSAKKKINLYKRNEE